MGFFDKLIGKSAVAKPNEVEVAGGMTTEKAKEIQTVEEFINTCTPKEKAAFSLLKSLPNYSKLLTNPKNLDFVKKFASNYKDIMPSASYDEETNTFSATGKVVKRSIVSTS
ncbi:MAG: hypothetical protein NTZ44_03155 [Candidatus Nomurabacteria bacterium]|nr:hypothetical protein [Candidatus Nomurabacteria bacterium]